jgi:antitoxin (DNA-binding transcriptional repressor) of toxin-antitoxin stability system
MIHIMKTATVRELRTAFPKVESWLAEGELVIITKAGKPVAQLCPPPSPGKLDFAARFGPDARRSVSAQAIDAVGLLSEERGE